jgi:hypothetical protein
MSLGVCAAQTAEVVPTLLPELDKTPAAKNKRKLHDPGQDGCSRASFRTAWKKGLGEFEENLATQKKWVSGQAGRVGEGKAR